MTGGGTRRRGGPGLDREREERARYELLLEIKLSFSIKRLQLWLPTRPSGSTGKRLSPLSSRCNLTPTLNAVSKVTKRQFKFFRL